MKYIILLLPIIMLLCACDGFTTTNTKNPKPPTTKDPITTENINNPVSKSLLQMRQKEQELQTKIDEASDLHGDEQALFELDEAQQKMRTQHLKELEKIIATNGWVSSKKYGKTACAQALSMLKYAPGEQVESHLEKLLEAAKSGEANPADVAYLHDKALMHQGKKQRYGTQIAFNPDKGMNDVYPIEDQANVNKRRAQVGLEPIEVALKKKGIKY